MATSMQAGFIGLGQMGSPMAERLIRADTVLHVFDPHPVAEEWLISLCAIGHPDQASVANAANVMLSCLSSPEVNEAVALGPDGIVKARDIHTHIEMSTIRCRSIGRIAAGLANQDVVLLDLPISGGPPGARAGTLAVIASG